ncbi:molybdopterin-dependent oxidoreductase, partial [Streptomyces sp. NPDC005423]|uniref:molybdopterin-dependent oxidoreductase n=1 Tax=Streptomyces sp. NPDC005423 TaxID=3155343 RepID=UPI0033B4960C
MSWRSAPSSSPAPARTCSTTSRCARRISARTERTVRIRGGPRPRFRGFPLRLVVPHLYAWKGPKW